MIHAEYCGSESSNNQGAKFEKLVAIAGSECHGQSIPSTSVKKQVRFYSV